MKKKIAIHTVYNFKIQYKIFKFKLFYSTRYNHFISVTNNIIWFTLIYIFKSQNLRRIES